LHGNINNTELIKSEAKNIGFSDCKISKPSIETEDYSNFLKWLEKGRNGEMGYMKNHPEKRSNPKLIYNDTKSIVTVLLNYNTREKQKSYPYFKVSKYAYSDDYHVLIKTRLKNLLNFIKKNISNADGRFFVDTAPILERALAKNSGVGWVGKNTCIITKNSGSFVFIGEIFLNIDLITDTPVKNYCGNCTKCIEACPTKAIIEPYVLDSKKCISYYTIEHRSDIPEDFKNKFNNWVFGCDICQNVCPWNKKNSNDNKDIKINHDLLNLKIEDWENLSPELFIKISKFSALKYISFKQLKRNINFNQIFG
jgi:epoxyqueuosine reductase